MTRARDERRWLGGLVLVTGCSWGRWLATGSLRVDENYPSAIAGTLLFLGMLSGWCLLVAGWRGLLLRPTANPRRLAFQGLFVTAFMLPMLSNDVFSLFAYGSLAAHGQEVYTTASGLSASVWYPFVGERWNENVCVYGPTTLVGILPPALAGGNPWLGLLLLRAAWFGPLALVMELSFRRMGDRPLFHAMVWLNPLWLLEGPGQLHVDLLGMVAVVAGILSERQQGRGRSALAGGWLLYALAVLGKYSFAFTGFWFWLFGAKTPRERALRLPAMAAVVGGVAVVFFAPFWKGPATVLEPLHSLSAMNPGGSITEVVGDLVLLLRGGHIPSPDTPVDAAVAADRAASAATWFAVSSVLRVVALGVAARVAYVTLRRPRDGDRIALGTGALVVAVATLASHRFEPWYLLPALPFFGLSCTEAWRRWWVLAIAVSATPTFIHLLPRTSMLLPVWGAASTGCMVLVFVLAFKARYWTLDDAPPGAIAPGAPSPQRAGN